MAGVMMQQFGLGAALGGLLALLALITSSDLAFAWSTIRQQDMVTIGTTTPDEAREVIDISLDLLNQRVPDYELQRTRSKSSLS